MAGQQSLFDAPAPTPALPDGMRLERDFLTPGEEDELVARIAQLPLARMRYQQYEALRRVVSYGGKYDFSARRLEAAAPIPAWLDALRERAAAWAGLAAGDFVQALVAEYQPGTPLGWHRDVPDFEDIVGISLAGDGVMRWRPYPPPADRRAATLRLVVPRRSVYLLRGPARWAWQHAVSPAKVLRYSITLRTARR